MTTDDDSTTIEEAGRPRLFPIQLLWQDNPAARRRTEDLTVRGRLRRAAAGRSRAKLFGRGVV